MSDLPKVIRRLKADDETMEKLHIAARNGNLEEVKRLIDMGVDPTIANRFGCTALHLACKNGHVATAEYLSSVGDVSTGWHGQKPIHLAVLSNRLPLVKALVEGSTQAGRSAEVLLNECDEMEVTEVGEHVKHSKGQTSLHWCVGLGEPYQAMLELLVSMGASPTSKDREGETPLMRALEFHNQHALDIFLGVKAGALQLHLTDAEGRTHLHWAITSNREDVALKFIELGHDVNMEDNAHVLPLHLAVRAAMPQLTEKVLELGDPFNVQNASFHNGTTVLEERIDWLPSVAALEDAEEQQRRKKLVIQLLQNKLDEINVALNPSAATEIRKRSNSTKKMNLAPSAPVRGGTKSKGVKKTTK